MPYKSFYKWNGKIQKDREKLLFIKTKNSLYKKIEQEIKKLHDYEIPEIIKIDISDGLPSYLSWIDEVCKV